jgi:hypothetical protein
MMMPSTNRKSTLRLPLAAALAALTAACAIAPQQPAQEPPASGALVVKPAPAEAAPSNAPAPGAATSAATPERGPLTPLAWLEGCWQGSVNQRDFNEHWLPLRGGMLVGAGQSVLRGKVDDYEFLRLEAKPDAIYFTQFSADRKETTFKLVSTTTDDKDTLFAFTNTGDGFPARLTYRRGAEGWLFETIEGPLNGADRKVIYPLHRVDCETGELIRQ